MRNQGFCRRIRPGARVARLAGRIRRQESWFRILHRMGGPDGGLKHNPFAALRGKAAGLPPGPAPAPDASAPAPKAASGRIVLRRERKGRGGKAVTLAEGPGLAGRDLETLAREAARALGVGARAEGGALVVQGEQVERLRVWLAARGLGPIVKGN
jgi:translation initiation factor 1